MRDVRKSGLVLVLIGGVMMVAACTARLETGTLAPPINPVSGNLAVEKQADNMKQGIGFGSFTVFAIPVMQIKVEGEADEELMRVVKKTVEHAGYETAVVNDHSEATGPVVGVSVKKFFFYNYTWLMPLVFNWGTIEMTVRVEDPQGNELWTKDYKESGVGMYDFNPTVNMALNKVLNQVAADFSSPEFQQAVLNTETPLENTSSPDADPSGS